MGYKDPEQRRKYAREWVAKRRVDFFADKRCVQCGSTDRMELDHIDRTQKVSHSIWSWSAKRRNAEIAKCQVLCHDCHVDKTWTQDFQRAEHGTPASYRRGCRCDKCRESATLDRQRYSRNKNAIMV